MLTQIKKEEKNILKIITIKEKICLNGLINHVEKLGNVSHVSKFLRSGFFKFKKYKLIFKNFL